jgi:HNH endonuclease
MHGSFVLKDRSNRQLLAEVKNLVGQECNATAYLIAHLSEIEARSLHLEEGCSSMFKYCTEVLHLSESGAYRRIDVARVARKFPVIFEMLAEGSINMTTVLILGPCLTEENHQELLAASRHQNKEEVEKLAVEVRPRPDVPSVIRKLPDLGTGSADPGSLEIALGSGDGLGSLEIGVGIGAGAAPLPVARATLQPEPLAGPISAPVRPVPSQRPVVSPLSPERYKIQFTANAETCRKLRQLQELLRHQVPNGDIAAIVDRGLTLLLEQVKREKLAQVKRPRKKAPKAGPHGGNVKAGARASLETGSVARSASRHIPAEVKRTVWERDQGQCGFVSQNGRRCSERGRLEFHHVEPYAVGGEATTENIALRCRAHNAHEGERVFGARAKKGSAVEASVGEAEVAPREGVGCRTHRALDVAHGARRNELSLERVSSKTRSANA